jgi:ribosomal protein S18 acetylase RimI-like enzyme
MTETANNERSSEPDAFVIRPADARDVQAMAALLGELYASDASAVPAIFAVASDADRLEYISTKLSEQNERFFVATSQGEVVGMLSFEEVRREQRLGRQPDHHVMINLLVVKDSRRREGVGRRLMRHARDWAKAQGFETLRVHVWEFNEPARRLYESQGYMTLSRVMAVDL